MSPAYYQRKMFTHVRKIYLWFAWPVATITLSCLMWFVYESSVPGGASSWFVLLVIIVVPVLFVLYLVWWVMAIAWKQAGRRFLAFQGLSLGLFALGISGLPMHMHWRFMQPTLEKAVAEGTCPKRAGLASIDWCYPKQGHPAFYFGGGFINHSEVVKIDDPRDLDPHYRAQYKLSDGWWLVYIPFD